MKKDLIILYRNTNLYVIVKKITIKLLLSFLFLLAPFFLPSLTLFTSYLQTNFNNPSEDGDPRKFHWCKDLNPLRPKFVEIGH